MEEKQIRVPISWLEDLLIYAEKAEEKAVRNKKTDLSLYELFGYISSAKTLIKYNEIKND